ncbi:hypothetical protein O181_016090 [Austropuccinia psidii MF-1]|uniref:Uncharacterized protein n=1 Tax=Austropuccinia psidii MF-1 TaxID=1389203 RepID=A0A9Q3C471_9BASI|nr:hypothetical protein [Austropuccinia psidii MF-1]
MPVQHSPPTRQTRPQAIDQAVLTPTPRAPLDGTPAEEGSDGTEAAPDPLGTSQGTEGSTLAQLNKYDPSLLAIMQKMPQIMANLQEASSSEALRPPTLNNPSLKAPECVYGTQPFGVRSLIQSCQLIFHNHLANFSQERKKVLYSTSFLVARAAKWI